MAERMLKCYGFECSDNGIKWPKSKLTVKNGKNYCDKCLVEMIKEEDGRATLYGIIKDVFQMPFPNGMMLRQIKEFRRVRTYEYEDIAKAILYAKYVLHKDMTPKFGLGLIPYVIEDAKAFYIDQKEKIKNMEGKTIQNENVKARANIKRENNTLLKSKMIDMENILND